MRPTIKRQEKLTDDCARGWLDTDGNLGYPDSCWISEWLSARCTLMGYRMSHTKRTQFCYWVASRIENLKSQRSLRA